MKVSKTIGLLFRCTQGCEMVNDRRKKNVKNVKNVLHLAVLKAPEHVCAGVHRPFHKSKVGLAKPIFIKLPVEILQFV